MLLQRGFQQNTSGQVLVYLSLEGEKRELLYFQAVSALLNSSPTRSIRLECDAKPHESSPQQVIDRAKAFQTLHSYADPNRMWLVMDADRGYLEKIGTRLKEIANLGYRLGISNPCFELWLGLHDRDILAEPLEKEACKAANTFDMGQWREIPNLNRIHAAIRRAEALPGSAAIPFPNNPGTQLAALFRYLGFAA